MTTDLAEARRRYRYWSRLVRTNGDHGYDCWLCNDQWLRVEAASLEIDCAVAAECDERIRSGVAWA